MQVQHANNVKLYNVASGRSVPDWLSERRRRRLQQQDEGLRRRIQLIQDFDMPAASLQVAMSRDGGCIMATGVYKPRIRCYEVDNLAMKFERHLTCDPVAIQPLSGGYEKMAFLLADRTIEVHAKYGFHYRTRIPKFGRGLDYHRNSCELYCVGSGPDIYRLNIEKGRFTEPHTTQSPELTSVVINHPYDLCFAGGIDGRVEAWDPRAPARCVARLDVARALVGLPGTSEATDLVPEISALTCTSNGLSLAVGTSTGQCLVYDIRSREPLLIKDHQYDSPIHAIHFHTSGNVLSADRKIIKMWDRETGQVFTSLEPDADINGFCVAPVQHGHGTIANPVDSGLVLLALEQPRMGAYFIPELGSAPGWCSFLESITDELEEDASAATGQAVDLYDDYKFVTRRELDELGLAHLVGSSLLRAYMHGFFIDIRLYHKAKSIAQPFAFDEYRQTQIAQKIEEQRENRIRVIRKRLPKVNREYAQELLTRTVTEKTEKLEKEQRKEWKAQQQRRNAQEELDQEGARDEDDEDVPFHDSETILDRVLEEERRAAAAKAAKAEVEAVANPLGDSRFDAMFKDATFSIDRESEEYKLLHPVVAQVKKDSTRERLAAMFEEVGGESDDEDERERMAELMREERGELVSEEERRRAKGGEEDDDDDEEDNDEGRRKRQNLWAERRIRDRERKKKKEESKKMFVVREGEDEKEVFDVLTGKRKSTSSAVPLGARLRRGEADADDGVMGRTRTGGMEYRFNVEPKQKEKKKKKRESGEEEESGGDAGRAPKRERRGVKELGLSNPDRKAVFWRGQRVTK